MLGAGFWARGLFVLTVAAQHLNGRSGDPVIDQSQNGLIEARERQLATYSLRPGRLNLFGHFPPLPRKLRIDLLLQSTGRLFCLLFALACLGLIFFCFRCHGRIPLPMH
jgi:hypothetical protein